MKGFQANSSTQMPNLIWISVPTSQKIFELFFQIQLRDFEIKRLKNKQKVLQFRIETSFPWFVFKQKYKKLINGM